MFFGAPEYTEAQNTDFPVVSKAEETTVIESDYTTPQDYPTPETRTELKLPSRSSGSFKTYMGYKTITNKNSKQYEMQQKAYTDENGFRIYDDCYMVAMGTYYAKECGVKFAVTLEDGTEFYVITGDIKQKIHTNETNQYVPHNGNIIEFIVDTKKIPSTCRKMGDMSYAGLRGGIIKIERVD